MILNRPAIRLDSQHGLAVASYILAQEQMFSHLRWLPIVLQLHVCIGRSNNLHMLKRKRQCFSMFVTST